MDFQNEIFSENIEHSSEKILEKVKKGEWNDILYGLCSIKENIVLLNYVYFKHIAKEDTYKYILNYLVTSLDNMLIMNSKFIVHLNMKNLTITDIDKHKIFIQEMADCFKNRYPQKLEKCYVYNAPFIFSQIYNMIGVFIDKETQQKIELVNKPVKTLHP